MTSVLRSRRIALMIVVAVVIALWIVLLSFENTGSSPVRTFTNINATSSTTTNPVTTTTTTENPNAGCKHQPNPPPNCRPSGT
jgi:hypothetical protein